MSVTPSAANAQVSVLTAQVLFAWVFPWVCGSGSPPVLWLLRPVEKGCEPAEQACFVVVFWGVCVTVTRDPLHVGAARSAANACLL